MKCTSQCLYRVIILLLRLSHKQFFGLRYERHRGSKWFRGLNNFDFLAPPILLFGHGCILVTNSLAHDVNYFRDRSQS